jgi:hypothetical protein
MAKLDYKKLLGIEKKARVMLCIDYGKILRENISLKEQLKDAASWEQLYNKQQGQATGIMQCFKELLNAQNK